MSHKKIAVSLTAALLALGTACGSSTDSAGPSHTTASPSSTTVSPSTAAGKPARATETATGSSPTDLEGHWNSPAEEAGVDAEITDNSIVVTMTGDSGSKSLYWKGTFPAPDGSGTVVSQGDVKAMSKSILGSESKTKEFHYAKGQLVFTFTIGDKSLDIHLER